MGEGDSGKPIVVVRGLSLYHESYGIKELYRPEKDDEIRRALIRSQSA